MRVLFAAAIAAAILASSASAQPAAAQAATRHAYLDKSGVVRWRDNDEEVALFGANYCLMSGSDYRMAGLVGGDRKKMIDEDMAQFARMGWTALRLCSWGDWENSDAQGNLIVNDHVDLLDYLVAKARERGIYILLTPIHGYSPAFPDQMDKPTQNVGFSRWFEKPVMGTDKLSIAAQANYIGQLLKHVNPYTGTTLKDEPALLFVEVINEPIHHPEDLKGSVAYINALVKAVRDTGADKITFFNVSQDFRIAEAIRELDVDGASFGWYPSGLVAGRTLKGNFLQAVDSYPDMLRPELNGKPRIVYEFDTADMNTNYMYPAMARTYRAVGTQFASMFAYDQLETAPYNLGWQTHFLNLVHTPGKAVSAIIAAEAMRRLPRYKSYGRYPDDLSFGDFRVSYEENLSELVAADAYMNAGTTQTPPRDPRTLQRIVGFGSSPVVDYEGTGVYFLDKVRDGVWRLEVYPDEVLVRDPFEQPRPDKIVSRLLYRAWPMRVNLPDLGAQFIASPVNVPNDPHAAARRAGQARFDVEPGVWLLSAAPVEKASLPASIDRVGFDEFHVNRPQSYPDLVLPLAPEEFEAGAPVRIAARVADDTLPDKAELWLRPAGTGRFAKPIAMTRSRGNDYAADAGKLAPGLYEYAVSTTTGAHATTFPGAVSGRPDAWPFFSDAVWTFRVTPVGAPLRLLDPRADYKGDHPAVDFSWKAPYIRFRDWNGAGTVRKASKRIHQMTIGQWEKAFPDDDACRTYLVACRWPDGVYCPRCGNPEVSEHGTRAFNWQCYACSAKGTSYRFSVLVGTIFENTKYPLRAWFRVIHMMLTAKKGVAALEVHRVIGTGSYETAWSMCHRIRAGLANEDFRKLIGVVEVDETFIGGKAKNKHWDKRDGKGGGTGSGKSIVAGAVTRKGNVVARVIADVTTDTLTRFVRESVATDVSLLCTDQYTAYRDLGLEFPHGSVDHAKGQYVVGAIHTNTIEGFWSLIKRGVVGTYHKVSRKYLPLYVAEFQFRYNNRLNEDIFGEAIRGC